MPVLRIDSSANTESSVTRALTDRIIAKLDQTEVTVRDLAKTPLPQITHTWAEARAIADADRSAEQKEALKLSDTLIAELKAADTIVIGAPVYNFSIPAALKAWIDLVARAGETFTYTDKGPEGLVGNKRVIVAYASGGTAVGSEMDFSTAYLKAFLGFIGITDVTVIAADALAMDAQQTIADAHAAVDALTA